MKQKSFLRENGLILLLFAVGLGAILYSPFVRAVVDVKLYRQSQRFLQGVAPVDQVIVDERIAKYREYNREQAQNVQGYIDPFLEAPTPELAERNYSFDSDDAVFAVLAIPRLQLEYPIYLGATPEHLLEGLAVVRGSSLPVGGENSHSVIAGHNYLTHGEFFSDIDQLNPGDDIYVKSPLQRLHYKVQGSDFIAPTDTDYLNVVEGHDRLSLLTCYRKNPVKNRLVVFADRVTENNIASDREVPTTEAYEQRGSTSEEDSPLAWLIYAKPIAIALGYLALIGLLITILIYCKRRGQAS